MNKGKQDLVPRLVFFSIFMVLAAICMSLDAIAGLGATSILTVGGGLVLATGAAVAMTPDEFLAQRKHALTSVDLTSPEKVEAFKNAIADGNKPVADKLTELITEIKAGRAISETPANQHFYTHLLSEKENGSQDEKEKYRLGFNRYVRTMYRAHKNIAQPEEIIALQKAHQFMHSTQITSSDSLGGYGLPVQTGNVIFDALRDSGMFFGKTTVFDVALRAGSTFRLPTVGASGHPAPSRVAEAGAKPVANMTFGLTTFTLEKYACIIPWSDEMDQDSVIDMEQIIRQFAPDYFNILFDDILFRGDANIDGIYDFTTTYQEIGGTSFSSVTVDDIIRAEGKMRAADLVGAEWFMAPSVWAELQTKKGAGDGQYLISQNDVSGMMLRGRKVNLTDSAYALSESGAAKPFITLGNLKKAYVARKGGLGISVSDVASWVDGETTKHAFQENLTAIRLEMRADLQMPFPLRIVQVKTAAA